MGSHDILFLAKAFWPVFGTLNGIKVVELGDQKIHDDVLTSFSGDRLWAKDLFEAVGAHHYSIDWHGQNGAYPLDLSKPIEDKFWLGRFDMLTNFGTIEHVSNQYECWRNAHNLLRPNGLFIHSLPVDWPADHCDYLYSRDFVFNLAVANKYEIILFEAKGGTLKPSGRKFRSAYLAMIKKEEPFVPKKAELESWIKQNK